MASYVESLSNMSYDHILSQINPTHDLGDEIKLDYIDSLLVVVGNILKGSSHIIHNLVTGTKLQEENLKKKVEPEYARFTSPTCILKTLSSEMACKAPADASRTTMSILGKLSKYSWETKAVLTIAAFAMEYGDFLLLVGLNSSHQVAESVGILKRAPAMLKQLDDKFFMDAIVALDGVIKNTLKVIESIFALKKLYSKYCTYDIENITELSASALKHIPVDVYWAIKTIAACTTQLHYCISGDHEVNKQQLSWFHKKIITTLEFLQTQKEFYQIQLDEYEAEKELRYLSRTPSGIVQLLMTLIFGARKAGVHESLIIDGCSKVERNIKELENKNIFLFISGLDISIDDISILNPIYDDIKNKDEYKILWIPIVDRWTNDLEKKFEKLRLEMKWYIVKYFLPIVGIKFIPKVWKYQKRSLQILQINSKGSVEYLNIVHRIRLWGNTVDQPISTDKWMGDLMGSIYPKLQIEENKYIFFYGGKGKEWVQRFNKKANNLAKDPVIKNAKIPVESFCVGKDIMIRDWENDLRIVGCFWNKVESLFLFNYEKLKRVPNPVTKEIQKLLSYKNEKAWAVLCKGSRVVLMGHWEIIDKVVDDFNKWKPSVRERGFEYSIKEHHANINGEVPNPCCRVDISMLAGQDLPDDLTCPYCFEFMETYTSFNCCHSTSVDNGAMNGLHALAAT